eukprot:m.550110 g.550110  ORF g.550110 m.550110 type:complete len:126 (+) comp22161_c0_seq8:39-416(+)
MIITVGNALCLSVKHAWRIRIPRDAYIWQGGISHLDIAHFWGGVLDHPLMSAVPPLVPFVEATSADNIAAEIFDMVCPKHPDLITVKELVSCGLGHTICGLLTDFDAFYFHETNFHVDRDRAELV